MIDSGDEVAIYDCGMAYCHEGLIKTIKDKLAELGHDKLDKVVLSHTHYDHMGALPYIIREWPDVKVIGGAKAKKVFASDGAKALMRKLGEAARDKYLPPEMHDMEIEVDGIRVDEVIEDGEHFSIGKYDVLAIWTPGHTDCSFAYLMNPGSIMFASESVGVLENEHHLHTSILKSMEDTIESAEKLKAVNPDVIICSHYGLVPESIKDKYFDMYIECALQEKEFILSRFDKGYDFMRLAQDYEDEYWSLSRSGAQPIEAFRENVTHILPLIVKTYRDADLVVDPSYTK